MALGLRGATLFLGAVGVSACSLLTSFDGFGGGRDAGKGDGSGSGSDADSENAAQGDGGDCTPTGPGNPPGGTCGKGNARCAQLPCACNDGSVIDSTGCDNDTCAAADVVCPFACSGLGGWSGHC